MTFEQLFAPVAFGFVTSITPGPNDMTPMASGANYGVRRTVPRMLGVAIGFVVMAVLTGAGLARAFVAVPARHTALRWVSASYPQRPN